ncbi:NAD(P)-dependent oxidoreductase [Gammaproteobacteria bacterium]|nr:NAD(P)-dependent oxidoreductase [Gammaproteobacteria bacterium]
MKKKGFIGLGVMGYPMAGHLSSNGFDTCVFNRTSEKAEQWSARFQGEVCKTPAEIASMSDIIFLCVGRDEDVREVLIGEGGVLLQIRPGTIVVDHTTTSALLAKEMNDILLKKQCFYLDAPVSGGQAGAEAGQLSVMVGGDKNSYESVKETLDVFSKFTKYMGKSGSGQLTKMVNQICIGGLIQVLAEGINFSEKAGLNTADVIEVITKGAAQSWQMENRWETMLADDYDHGFAVDWMRKDLDIVSAEASKIGADIEITDLVNMFYKDIQDLGGNRWDTSSLLKRIQEK